MICTLRLTGLALGALILSTDLLGAGPFRNRDNPNLHDKSEGTYPIPYQRPVRSEIEGDLQRILGYLEQICPTRVVDRETGEELTDPTAEPSPTAVIYRTRETFTPITYVMGLAHSGMLRAHEVTGDTAYLDFTERHLRFLRDWRPYFEELEGHPEVRRNPFGSALEPDSLDDSGSMCAALIRAQHAGLVTGLDEQIEVWSEWVGHGQFRLEDGMLARHRPQRESIWADDAYMSIPCLAEMGVYSGDPRWFDDAVHQVLKFAEHLFVPEKGLYMHGKHPHYPEAPRFYWGRANGWVILAMCDLLDVLPSDHPGYEPVRAQLERALSGLAQYQDGNTGLWHQLIDHPNSYTETSSSAMFTYGFARAVNEGWINPTTNGSIALAGWAGLTQRINKQGGIEGGCVGTTLAGDPVYYYNRPVGPQAEHGYGAMILAATEIIRLLENPAFEVKHSVRTYHFIPKAD